MTRTRARILIVWGAALGIVMLSSWLQSALSAIGRSSATLGFIQLFAIIVAVGLTVYWIGVVIRYILRKLFWRVGRRLALSYFLIGVLPFILFAILLTVIFYAIAGVLSQASYRSERQEALTRLDQWNLEYTLAGTKPAQGMSSLEIYDIPRGKTSELPEWLTSESFTGLVIRDRKAALVSARLYDLSGKRSSVVLVQPLDREWAERMEAESGMVVSYSVARSSGAGSSSTSDGRVRVTTGKGGGVVGINIGENEAPPEADTGDPDVETEALDESMFETFFERAWRPNGVIWGDLTPPLITWETGQPEESMRLWTFIWNPWRNLVEFYFGGSQYAQIVLATIGSIAGSLLLIYLPATLLAAVLIFSISRAVNRIEKGTHAVERGDFSYRIRMKPRNQLGQMALSFDRMTESISTLLVKVAEKERLQSEIDIAASIQRNLLPREGPSFGGVSFSAHFEPTASIGGDYYDVFNLDKTRLAVAIGDVSGHGLSTGLVMAMVKAAMTTLVEEGADEVSLFRRLNDLVFRSTEKRAFMTLGFTIFDLEKAHIRHTNAGHLYPYVLRAGQAPHPLESSSLPLGVRKEILTETVEFDLREGDTVVYLSDGMIEAQNMHGDPFGFEEMERVLEAVSGQSAADVQEAILLAVESHSGECPPDDDRTVMVLSFEQLSMSRVGEEAEAPVEASRQ